MYIPTVKIKFSKDAFSMWLLGIFSFTQILLPFLNTQPVSAGNHQTIPEPKVNICHKTSDPNTPWEGIQVDQSAFDGVGSNDHTLHGDFLYFGPLKSNGMPDDKNNADGIWCSENVPNGEEEPGSLTVNKAIDRNGNGQFVVNNTAANNSGFRWGFEGETPEFLMGSLKDGLEPDTYNVIEKDVAGFSFVGWFDNDGNGSCTEPDGLTLPAEIEVESDKNTEITLCNVKDQEPKNGSITIIKDARPNSHQDFEFTIERGQNSREFTLDDDNDPTLDNAKTFADIRPDTYIVTENTPDGWMVKNIVCRDLNQQQNYVGVTQQNGNSHLIVLQSGQHIECTFINVRKKRGKVIVTKFDDIDANGKLDEGEDKLPGWEITLKRGEHTLQKTTNSYGKAHFNNVKPGYWLLDEILQDDWVQTSIFCRDHRQDAPPIEIDTLELQNFENGNHQSGKRIFIRPGEVKHCFIGNRKEPEFFLSKSNNRPNATLVGDIVTYTLVVTVPETSGHLFDAQVVDLPPEGFAVDNSSATGVSTVRGNISVSPNYSSPGIWKIGDLVPGEQVTLTYQAKIASTVTPGVYPDFAFAQADDATGNNVFAITNSTITGTKVTVISDFSPSGEVISSLPNTGPNVWPIALSVLGSIITYYWLERKRRLEYAKSWA